MPLRGSCRLKVRRSLIPSSLDQSLRPPRCALLRMSRMSTLTNLFQCSDRKLRNVACDLFDGLLCHLPVWPEQCDHGTGMDVVDDLRDDAVRTHSSLHALWRPADDSADDGAEQSDIRLNHMLYHR